MTDVISIVRASCNGRSPSGAGIDEPGITGVLCGTAPIVWAYDGVDIERLQEVLAASPEVTEVYVDERTFVAADALLNSEEWWLQDVLDQELFRPEDRVLPEVAAPCVIEAAGPADMHLVRRSLATAFQLPVRTIEASYPDDFFVTAAPARLFVARSSSGEVIGTIGQRRQADSAMIFGLSVRSDQRQRHVASALLATAMHSAVDDGATLLHGLSCDATHGIAARHGFERVGRWLHLLRVPHPAGR
jgi:N-acetylglutamate synthase-like GNAT family acetyltransferase